MEIRGIDVSAWQGKIDWKTVADYGMGFAILRITEAGNVIDSYFEQNFSECRKYNIPIFSRHSTARNAWQHHSGSQHCSNFAPA